MIFTTEGTEDSEFEDLRMKSHLQGLNASVYSAYSVVN
jgi:hypothetical protein